MVILLFILVGTNLLLALVIGVFKQYNLITDVNTATPGQKARTDFPKIGKTLAVGFGTSGFVCAICGICDSCGKNRRSGMLLNTVGILTK